jgi:hypothetical protein
MEHSIIRTQQNPLRLARHFRILAAEGRFGLLCCRLDGPQGRLWRRAALDAVCSALACAGVVHFDATGFRVSSKCTWVHSASSGKYVLVTVHAKRVRTAWTPPGVLPAFAGTACHGMTAVPPGTQPEGMPEGVPEGTAEVPEGTG